MKKTTRTEVEIFSELEKLCQSAGYVHVISYFCFRDILVKYSGKLKPKDLLELYQPSKLIRTEISTLLGLLIKKPINDLLPSPTDFQSYVETTERLLEEIHASMNDPMMAQMHKAIKEGAGDPFSRGEVYREPIFYAGESAYIFQYRDLVIKRYQADDPWLTRNKGFSIGEARTVVDGICKIQLEKLVGLQDFFIENPPEKWTCLHGHEFSIEEVAAGTGISIDVVRNVVTAFSVEAGDANTGFTSVSHFNESNVRPILSMGNGRHYLFQMYSIYESLNESPFFWFLSDPAYFPTATANRGKFTEDFCHKRLCSVFGSERVYLNPIIQKSKSETLGEIDVLVVFGDRAIVLQAKSKKLTIEARKGNDRVLKNDFSASIKDSYQQGLTCAKALLTRSGELIGADGIAISLSIEPKEIYLICAISDNYPALSFQAREFLDHEDTKGVPPPFVMDIFTLDVMAEMLDRPLWFLSYINRRTTYSKKFVAQHELTVLAHHLKNNLWIEGEKTLVVLGDDIAVELDMAMAVRREGLEGKKIPDGVLTKLRETTLGKIIGQIEHEPSPVTIDLGFFLLSISGEATTSISNALEKLAEMEVLDRRGHDISLEFSATKSGITIHCTSAPDKVSVPKLKNHCSIRKYVTKSNKWYGICVWASPISIRFCVNLDSPWEVDEAFAESIRKSRIAKKPQTTLNIESSRSRSLRIKPNDICVCGSGLKYKKCCGKN